MEFGRRGHRPALGCACRTTVSPPVSSAFTRHFTRHFCQATGCCASRSRSRCRSVSSPRSSCGTRSTRHSAPRSRPARAGWASCSGSARCAVRAARDNQSAAEESRNWKPLPVMF